MKPNFNCNAIIFLPPVLKAWNYVLLATKVAWFHFLKVEQQKKLEGKLLGNFNEAFMFDEAQVNFIAFWTYFSCSKSEFITVTLYSESSEQCCCSFVPWLFVAFFSHCNLQLNWLKLNKMLRFNDHLPGIAVNYTNKMQFVTKSTSLQCKLLAERIWKVIKAARNVNCNACWPT